MRGGVPGINDGIIFITEFNEWNELKWFRMDRHKGVRIGVLAQCH